MKQTVDMNDMMSFKDKSDEGVKKHGLRGHVTIHRRNRDTGETKLWYEDDNVISISGMQYILMKMFNLYLDSSHGTDYETLDRDTNLVIPDLNQSSMLGIGTDPSSYTTMNENIASSHFIQGFMIGNGGSGEDQMTTKNTDYSFINLRNPIPFQQINDGESLPSGDEGKYIGKLRDITAQSYFIKKFEQTPHIYHSWWRDGQKWDYVDPVTQNDLGPDASNGAGKTNRIETYLECKLALSESDCAAYFANAGNTQTPAINELGLVAFDTTGNATRDELTNVYQLYVKPLIDIVFDSNKRSESDIAYMVSLASNASATLTSILAQHAQTNISACNTTLMTITSASSHDFDTYQTQLKSSDNIGVVPYYTESDGVYTYAYATDQFMDYVADDAFDDDTQPEAERIKLITYYTFKSIPIEENWETLINYRIYAN